MEDLRVPNLYEAAVGCAAFEADNIVDASLNLRMTGSRRLSPKLALPLLNRPHLGQPSESRCSEDRLAVGGGLASRSSEPCGATRTRRALLTLIAFRPSTRKLDHPVTDDSRASPGQDEKHGSENQQFPIHHGAPPMRSVNRIIATKEVNAHA